VGPLVPNAPTQIKNQSHAQPNSKAQSSYYL
jgi:hypothetical protein